MPKDEIKKIVVPGGRNGKTAGLTTRRISDRMSANDSLTTARLESRLGNSNANQGNTGSENTGTGSAATTTSPPASKKR
jgi:hypothetical protein